MKQSLNPASVKGISASPLRALSGDLKCTTAGQTAFGYQWIAKYSTVSGVGRVNFILNSANAAPLGKPYAKWVCRLTTNIAQSMPVSAFNGNAIVPQLKFSLSEHAVASEGYGGSVAIVPSIANNAWSTPTFTDSFGTQSKPDMVGRKWFTGSVASFGASSGPDILSIGTIDLASSGTNVTFTILPAQPEFCSIQFYPFYFEAQNDAGSAIALWTSIADAFGIIGNFGSTLRWAPNLFPDNTVLGTVTIDLFRIETTPLFVFSITPPRTFTFTNISFFNSALSPTWDWDFGDGSAHSALQNPPTHTYAAVGVYNVRLTASDITGKVATFDQFVIFALKADFTFHLDGAIPAQNVFQVTFTNRSIAAQTYDWDFGDGSAHSNAVNPVHKYPRNGTFQCKLTAFDNSLGNSTSITKTIVTA